jgi:hypothetical protein
MQNGKKIKRMANSHSQISLTPGQIMNLSGRRKANHRSRCLHDRLGPSIQPEKPDGVFEKREFADRIGVPSPL